jgi:hypothetical protein
MMSIPVRRCRRVARCFALSALSVLAAWPAAGQNTPVPLSAEFRVDQQSTTWQYSPHAIALGGGRTVVVWEQDVDGIFARFFDASGAPEGSDRRLVASAGVRAPFRGVANLRRHPSAQPLPDGGFLLAWTEERTFLSSSAFYEQRRVLERDVLVQRFGADGSPVGDRFVASADRAGQQSHPQLARRGDGGFVVAWRTVETVDSAAPEREGVYLRAIAGSGEPQGAELRLDEGMDSEPGVPAVAFNAAGAGLVAWDACCDEGGDRGIFARSLGVDLAATGPVFRVNETASFAQTWPAIAANGEGDFLVAWQAVTGVQQSRYGQRRVRGQLVGAGGGLLGGELVLSTGRGWGHDTPRLAAGHGGMLLAWLVFDGDFPIGIASARLGEDGERLSDAAWVSQSRTIGNPSSVHAGGDRFLVTWLGVLSRQRAVAARFVGLE